MSSTLRHGDVGHECEVIYKDYVVSTPWHPNFVFDDPNLKCEIFHEPNDIKIKFLLFYYFNIYLFKLINILIQFSPKYLNEK